MTELRSYRLQTGLSQAELAHVLRVALNSFRMWDSGLRPTPRDVLELARIAAADALRGQQLLNLPDLATELKVHVRTLQAAARTGRLEVQYAVRSVFGRPRRLSTRAAGRVFLRTYYRRYRGQPGGRFALAPAVPEDYARRLRHLRNRLRLSQADLAELVGAAPTRPWCISGNQGSECRPPSSGIAFWWLVVLGSRRRPPSAKIGPGRP